VSHQPGCLPDDPAPCVSLLIAYGPNPQQKKQHSYYAGMAVKDHLSNSNTLAFPDATK